MKDKTPAMSGVLSLVPELLAGLPGALGRTDGVKKANPQVGFFSTAKRLLLFGVGSSSGSRVFSGGASSGRSGSGSSSFSGLGVSSRSGSGSSSFSGLGFSGGGSRSGRGSSGGSSSRSFNGLRLFLLAASGNSECNESSNQERLFHCWFPLSINEVQQA